MTKDPAGFLSYVRDDDAHENGRLSEFCNRLAGEVRMQSGEKFEIFQDRNDIAWGQQWKQRIEDSLDSGTFLFPIITPRFLASPACRDELERFLNREMRLKRADLILPVYYINCPVLNDEQKRKGDPLAMIVAERQYADWRELRFEPFTSPQIGKMLAKMAGQVVEALERQPLPGRQEKSRAPHTKKRGRSQQKRAKGPGLSRRADEKSPPAQSSQQMESAGQSTASRGPVAKIEPPTLIVDALHRGDHSTLTAALAAAKPGDRILVRPGLYREGVVIDKAVEIIGDGEVGDVVVEASGRNAVLFKANMGRIANLTLRQMGVGGKSFCVSITQGRLDLEGCDITSQSLACVAIRGGADPRLRRNRIHDGNQGGVFLLENALGTLEDNDIFGNALSGVEIKENSNPILRRNRIHDGKQGGVLVNGNGLGTLEDNDIFGNAFAGVYIRGNANPILRRNRIHDGKQAGVLVYEKAEGTLHANEIFANALVGVEIKSHAKPILRGNTISKNGYQAIYVYENGGGVFEENDLRGNSHGAWDIAPDCEKNVKRSGNLE